eukprot:scaffold66711_cov48-Phaeocystis_antarctica.AAC.1
MAFAYTAFSSSRTVARPGQGQGQGRGQGWGQGQAVGAQPDLKGQRWGNARLWRRLARAAEAVAGSPGARPLLGSTGPLRAARRALGRRMGQARALP